MSNVKNQTVNVNVQSNVTTQLVNDHVNSIVQSHDANVNDRFDTRFKVTQMNCVESDVKIVEHPPLYDVKIRGVKLQVMADTGASCNVIDQSTYHKVFSHVELDKTVCKVNPYGQNSLKPIGKFVTEIQYNGKSVRDSVYVLPGKSGCLLGVRTSQILGMVTINVPQRVNSLNSMNTVADNVEKQFPNISKGIGRMKDKQFKLHIDRSYPAVIQRCRRLPFNVRSKVEEELDRLLKNDIIEPADGPTTWVSPIVVVPKSDSNAVRICVDMKEANKAIIRERHPMPTLDDLSEHLRGCTIFSKIDLRQGYLQLELDPESRDITTFITHKGLFRSKRLSFGINSASEIFQKAIEEAIADVPQARNISDDVIIGSSNQAEHDAALNKVLENLSARGLTVNLPKCVFNTDCVKYYGMIFSAAGMQPDPVKVEALSQLAPPTNVTEVQSLLGMLNFCARLVPNFSTLTAPMRQLLRKDALFQWTTKQQSAFDTIVQWLQTEPVLSYFDTNLESHISVDASPVGLGAVLSQTDKQGNSKIIAYASRSLTDTEQRYSQLEREALGIVWSCERFHIYIYGKPVTVTTDHKPLLGVFSKSGNKLPTRLERWQLRLQPYMPDIKYAPGKENPADYLSRHPIANQSNDISSEIAEDYINFISHNAVPKAMSLQEIAEVSCKDPTFTVAKELVKSGKWYLVNNTAHWNANIDLNCLLSLAKVKTELSVTQDGILLRGSRILIPPLLQKQVVDLAHIGHQGIVKTKMLLREKVWFPGLDQLVESKISSCIACKCTHDSKPRNPLQMTNLPEKPWSSLCTDFFGPLPSGHYLMVVADEYSRFPEVEVLKSLSAKSVILKFDKIFASRGIPDVVKSDNGTPFQSSEFAEFAKELGFKHKTVTPYWPEANGQAENFMKGLGKLVKCAQVENKDWQRELCSYLRNYRATPHSSTGVAPASALNGYSLKTQLPEIVQVGPRPNFVEKDVRSKETMKQNAERRRNIKETEIRIGDTVLMKETFRKGKLIPPFQPLPFKVIGTNRSMITAARGSEIKTRNSSHFKRVNLRENSECENDSNEFEFVPDNPVSQGPITPGTITPSSTPVDSGPNFNERPSRTVRKPKRFSDYV